MNIFLNNTMLLLIFIFNSCTQIEDVKKDLMGDDTESIIEAAIWIQKNEVKDTSIVIQLLTHVMDPSVCTSSFKYYMETSYTNRILALEKLTGKKCPYVIKEEIDALIVDYYLDWAVHKGFIKTKNDINVIPAYLRQIEDSKSFKEDILNAEKVSWLDKYNWERSPFNDDNFHN